MKLKKGTLTSRELEQLFGVTTQTVVNWRKGSTRIEPLPSHFVQMAVRNKVYFKWAEVKKWATKNNLGDSEGLQAHYELLIATRK